MCVCARVRAFACVPSPLPTRTPRTLSSQLSRRWGRTRASSSSCAGRCVRAHARARARERAGERASVAVLSCVCWCVLCTHPLTHTPARPPTTLPSHPRARTHPPTHTHTLHTGSTVSKRCTARLRPLRVIAGPSQRTSESAHIRVAVDPSLRGAVRGTDPSRSESIRVVWVIRVGVRRGAAARRERPSPRLGRPRSESLSIRVIVDPSHCRSESSSIRVIVDPSHRRSESLADPSRSRPGPLLGRIPVRPSRSRFDNRRRLPGRASRLPGRAGPSRVRPGHRSEPAPIRVSPCVGRRARGFALDPSPDPPRFPPGA